MDKKAARVDEICDRLATRFGNVVPLSSAEAVARKARPGKDLLPGVEAGLGRFYEAAREERVRHRLGVLARARVAFGLQKRLLAAGYAPALVKQVVFAMLLSAFVGRQV